MRLALLLLVACGSPAKPAPLTSTGPRPLANLAALTGAAPSCGGFHARTRDTLDVVEGRLRVLAPHGSADVPKSYDIMSAPEPTSHESRVILEDDHGGKLVVYVYELWQSAPDDFAAKATPYFAHVASGTPLDVGRIDADPALAVIGAVPKTPDTNSEAVLLLATLVRTPDGSLLAVEYYVNPQAMTDAAGCEGLAIELARGMAPGKRALDSKGGTKTIGGYDVDVPPGFVVTHKPGPDFDVFFVRKLVPLGDYPGHLLVYEGDYANTDVPSGDGAPVSRTGKLAGVDATFQGYASDTGGEVVATVAVGHGQLQVIELATKQRAFLDELDGIAATIRPHRQGAR